MVRGIILGGIAFLAVFAAEHQFGSMTKDIDRYNKMREMSGDPPLGIRTQKPETNAEARTSNPFAMIASLPSDLARYLKLKSM